MNTERTPGWGEQDEYRQNMPDYSEFGYDTLTAEDIDWIVNDATVRAKELAEKIATSEELTWDTTMGRLNKIGSLVEHVYGKACFMADVHPDTSVRDTAYNALYTFFDDIFDIYFDQRIYEKISAYAESDEASLLMGERNGGVAGMMEFFASAGFGLPDKKREAIQRDIMQIMRNEITFQKNIDADRTVVPLTLEELAGMPQSYIDSLERDDQGNYLVTMQYPHVFPLVDSGDDWQARSKVNNAFNNRGIEQNRELLEETVRLRYAVAHRLGYEGWNQYQYDNGADTMVESSQEVESMHNKLLHYLRKHANREYKMMEKMIRAQGREGPVLASDVNYLLNKARQEAIPYDEEEAAKFFPLDAVMEGMNELDKEMFGLEYRQLSPEEFPVWHPDVIAYEVTDVDNGRKGKMVFDLFPRPGKYSHAAAFPLQYGYVLPDGTRQEPIVAIVCNFDPSGRLNQQNIKFLKHERGHGKHMICGQTDEISHSGFNVEWDNVELMSQITEYFMLEPEILKRISRHVETGEQIPDEFAKALCDSEKLYNATSIVLKVAKGEYDQMIHDRMPIGDFDYYAEEAKKISPFFHDEGSYFPATFAHIMGGYDSLFFGYQFTRIRAAMYYNQRFKPEGLTNPKTGRDFKETILRPGGTKYGVDMDKEFLQTSRKVKITHAAIKSYLRLEGIDVK